MTSVTIVFRPSTRRVGNPYKGSLALRLVHDRKMKQISIAKSCIFASEWDKDRKEIILPPDEPDFAPRRKYLLDLDTATKKELGIIREHMDLLMSSGRFRLENLTALHQMASRAECIGNYMKILAEELIYANQVRLARAYESTVRRFIRFNGGEDVELRSINAELMKRFERNLREESLLPNTISFYNRNLRAIYNRACKALIMEPQKINPFGAVFTGLDKTAKRALTVKEMRILHNVNFDLPRQRILYEAWLIFFFSFYACGMCFIDIVYLRKKSIRGGVLRYYRRKTGQPIEVKVTREMQFVFEYFMPFVKESEFCFPFLKNNGKTMRQQYETSLRMHNERLKRVAEEAGLSGSISAHVPRHTWASMGKRMHMPLPLLQECMGHSTAKTTAIYLQSFDFETIYKANQRITSILTLPTKRLLKEYREDMDFL